jgi:antitoxin (DNA-binding transcriptional repressor) of toxin-antitoxin stability system
MRFVSVRNLRGRSAQVWKDLAAEREMVVTSNGRPVAILSLVTDDTLEQSLQAIRRARAVAAVEALQAHSVKGGMEHTSLAEINAEIATIRRRGKTRRRRR